MYTDGGSAGSRVVASGVSWMFNGIGGVGEGREFRLGLKILDNQAPILMVTDLRGIS